MKILISNNDLFPKASEESISNTTHIQYVKLFKYLNVSFTNLRVAFVQLRSSLSSESVSKVHSNSRQKTAALDTSLVNLLVQSLRAEATLTAIKYLLQILIRNEISLANESTEACASLEFVQMTRTLHKNWQISPPEALSKATSWR